MAKDLNVADWPFPNERFMNPYSKIIQGQFAIDENDVGAPNVRQRSTTARRFLYLRFNISNGNWGQFEQWLAYSILHGALPFNIPDPQNYQPDDAGTWLKVRFAIEQMDNAVYSSMEWNVLQGYTLETIIEVL